MIKNKFFANKKTVQRTTAMSLVLSTFTGLAVAYASSGFEVSINRDNTTSRHQTVGLTIEQLFARENVILHPKDIIDVDLSTEIYENTKININSVEVVEFVIDDEFNIFFATNQKNIALALNEFKESMYYNFYLVDGQPSSTPVSNNMKIYLTTVEDEEIDYTPAGITLANNEFKEIAMKNPSISVVRKSSIDEQISDMVNAPSSVYKNSKGDYSVYVSVDGEWSVYKTNSTTVDEFFKSNKITITDKCSIDTDLDMIIGRDTIIHIDSAETINFVIDGEQYTHQTNKDNIEEIIKELEEEQNLNLLIEKDDLNIDEEITNDMTVDINTIEEKFVVVQEDVEFKIVYQENDSIVEGKEVVKTTGKMGVREIETKEVYRKDEFLYSELISDEIITQPVDQVIEIGTKYVENAIKTPDGVYSVKEKILMHSSAYTAGFESTGKNPGDEGYAMTASGMTAQVGVVAVDTDVIPFGTKMYIEGYGYAIAGDTGGAIQGNKIDVYFDTYAEAIQYGVKEVMVYILGEEL